MASGCGPRLLLRPAALPSQPQASRDAHPGERSEVAALATVLAAAGGAGCEGDDGHDDGAAALLAELNTRAEDLLAYLDAQPSSPLRPRDAHAAMDGEAATETTPL